MVFPFIVMVTTTKGNEQIKALELVSSLFSVVLATSKDNIPLNLAVMVHHAIVVYIN